MPSPTPPRSAVFSLATNFDDALPGEVRDTDVEELFGACDGSPVGHGRPRAVCPPVSWRRLEKHVAACRVAGLGFNLLLNPLCLGAREESLRLERRLRATLKRALDLGVTAVTVAHPWLLELAAETSLRVRVSVFVGITTCEQASFWAARGADVVALDTHVVSRDLPRIRHIARSCQAEVELPVNVGCLLRCPLARTHAARLSHSSLRGAQPVDACVIWCRQRKRDDPVELVRSDFIRPEDLGIYERHGVRRFKIVDRSCSTRALVERARAYSDRRWNGDLLELLGPRGKPPRTRLLPVLDAIRHLGVARSWRELRRAEELLDPTLPWVMDNRKLDGLLLPQGCRATRCEDCGHCAHVARRAVRRRAS